MEDKAARTLVVVLSALFASGLALGFDAGHALADDKSDAIKLIQQGDKYLEKAEKRRDSGRESRAIHYFEKALAAYEKAYALVPSPQIFYAIANAEAGLKRFKKALEHYQKVIAEVDKPALVEEAKARIEELAPEFAVIAFKITPEGAELSVDAELVGVAPMKQPVMLPPGKHTITVAAEEHNPQEIVLEVEAGTRSEQEVALEKTSVLVKRPAEDDGDSDSPDFAMPESRLPKKPGKVVLILGIAGTSVLAIASAATGIPAASADDDPALLYTSIGTGVAALGLGAYTVYHYYKVYRPRKERWEKQTAYIGPKLWLAPVVQADGGGVAVGGRF